MNRDLDKAQYLKHRFVLVRKGALTLRGAQPLDYNGYWDGTVLTVTPVVSDTPNPSERRIVDYTLKVRLSYGTARTDTDVELSYLSDGWKPRFPEKGEQ